MKQLYLDIPSLLASLKHPKVCAFSSLSVIIKSHQHEEGEEESKGRSEVPHVMGIIKYCNTFFVTITRDSWRFKPVSNSLHTDRKISIGILLKLFSWSMHLCPSGACKVPRFNNIDIMYLIATSPHCRSRFHIPRTAGIVLWTQWV